VVKLLNDKTVLAVNAVFDTTDDNAVKALITLGTQVLPFQANASPYDGATVTVSTSANTLILAKDKLANTLSLE
jgi:hypothetical protein